MNREVEKGRALDETSHSRYRLAHQTAARFDRAVHERAAGRISRAGGRGDHRARDVSAAARRSPPRSSRRSTRPSPRRAPPPKDMGRVMKAVMSRSPDGSVDGRRSATSSEEKTRRLNPSKPFRATSSNHLERHAQASHPSSIWLLSKDRSLFFVRVDSTHPCHGPVRTTVCPTVAGDARSSACASRLPTMSRQRLARSAGLIGVATMASRVLGVARETVLAATCSAPARQMDAFNVAFRVPNLLRDLFAEGAMTRGVRPDVHPHADRSAAASAPGGSAISSSTRCCSSPAFSSCSASSSPTRSRARSRREFARVPGKLELTTQLTRVMLPFLTTVARRRRDDGHAELAAPLLHSGALAGDVQRRDHRSARSRSCR